VRGAALLAAVVSVGNRRAWGCPPAQHPQAEFARPTTYSPLHQFSAAGWRAP
jgi:hypothetical protein